MILDKTVLESSFKIQCNYIAQYGKEYIRVKLLMANHDLLHDMVQEKENIYSLVDIKNDISISYCENYITYIDNILNSMECEYSRIIQNEFFSKKDHSWWYGVYSKSTFYRLKRKAVAEFLQYVV